MHSLIACEVFRAELEFLIREFQLSCRVHFLPQGLHDDPDSLRARLQEKIDDLESADDPPERISLCYGFCGRGLSGVFARKATLVLPRTHDCIPLLLGLSQKEKDALPRSHDTFWMSPGWLRYSQVPFVENRRRRYLEYKAKFDEDAAAYLMEMESSWLNEYSAATLICWDPWETLAPSSKAEAQMIAEDARLSCGEIRGTWHYMLRLLRGGDDEELFFHIPPEHTMGLTASGELQCVPLEMSET